MKTKILLIGIFAITITMLFVKCEDKKISEKWGMISNESSSDSIPGFVVMELFSSES